MSETDDPKLKVVVIGDEKVGKRSLLNQYFYKSGYPDSCALNEYVCEHNLHGKNYTFSFVFGKLGEPIEKPNGVIFLYDITQKQSFIKVCSSVRDEEVKYENIDKKSGRNSPSRKSERSLPFFSILIGNKIDLEDSRKVRREVGSVFTNYRNDMLFFEISAKDGVNVSLLFDIIIEIVSERYEGVDTSHRIEGYKHIVQNDLIKIQRNPNHFRGYFERGCSYSSIQKYQIAIEDFSKAIELIRPNDDRIGMFVNRGNAYCCLKQFDLGFADYSEGFRMYPQKALLMVNRDLFLHSMKLSIQSWKDDDGEIDNNTKKEKSLMFTIFRRISHFLLKHFEADESMFHEKTRKQFCDLVCDRVKCCLNDFFLSNNFTLEEFEINDILNEVLKSLPFGVLQDNYDDYDDGHVEDVNSYYFGEFCPFTLQKSGKGVDLSLVSVYRKWIRGIEVFLLPTYIGHFKNGLRNGEGRLYFTPSKSDSSNGLGSESSSSSSSNKLLGKIQFKGEFIDGVKEGKGLEYDHIHGDRENIFPKFEGLYSKDVRHGAGEEYDVRNGIVVRGTWEYGVLDKDSIFQYKCPYLQYSKFSKLLTSDNQIGNGGIGFVYKIKTSSIPELKNYVKDKYVAVKVIRSENTITKEIAFRIVKRSANLCYSVDSKHVLRIIAMFSENEISGCVMELCNKSIEQMISKKEIPDFNEKIRILRETSRGILDLHSKNIMHRDLKWSNVMVDFDNNVKLVDFDTLKEDERNWRFNVVEGSSKIGTSGFIAPEVFSGKRYSLACDSYSFGLMIYSILMDVVHPFSTQTHCEECGVQMSSIVTSGNLDYHIAHDGLRPFFDPKLSLFPRWIVDLMIQCWSADPFQRPSFEDISFRFEVEKNRSFTSIRLRFHQKTDESCRFAKAKDQITVLRKPYRISDLISWIEKKFIGSKVLSISHLKFGSVENDEELSTVIKTMEENGAGYPILDVKLDQISCEFLVQCTEKEEEEVEGEGEEQVVKEDYVKKLKRKIKSVKKESELKIGGLTKRIQELEGRNEELEKEIMNLRNLLVLKDHEK